MLRNRARIARWLARVVRSTASFAIEVHGQVGLRFDLWQSFGLPEPNRMAVVSGCLASAIVKYRRMVESHGGVDLLGQTDP